MRDGEPVRVLRVIARLNVGGPALHVSYLTRELDARGYETTLVSGTVGSGEGSMEYAARDRGIEPVTIPELQREIDPFRDLATARRLSHLMLALRPDVLHTHTAKAGAVGRTAALLAGHRRPPVIVHTFHGHVLRGYFGPAKTELFRRLERRLARVSDALVAVSPEVRDDLVSLGVADRERIAVIRLGLDLAGRVDAAPGAGAALRAQLAVPDDGFLVCWLGRMTEIKRVDVLLDAFAAALSSGADAYLALVGDGPLRGELETHAHRLGIASRCRFLGFREDVAPVYDAADAVALTSANEGTPVTLIEALAAGRPAISTSVGGVPDVVRDGVNGLLAPEGDSDAVAHAVARLAGDPALARRLGDAGRERARSRYAVPRLVTDVDTLYRELLAEKAPRSRRRVGGPLHRPLAPALTDADGLPAARRPSRERLRILVFSQYFPPEVGATQSRVQAFAEHLAARGHEVTVVCEFPNHPHGVIPDAYRGRVLVDDRSNPYRVLRVWVQASETKTQRTRMTFYLSYMALAAAAAPLAGRADVVVATSPPLFAAVAGALVARAERRPFVLDIRDLWPAAAVSLGQLSNAAALRASQRIERWLYREAAAVVAVTGPFCRHIDAIRQRPPATTLIPNGTLAQFFVGDGTPEARAAIGVGPDAFLATFAGNLGIAQALPTIVDAAELSRGELEFAFVGDGPIRDELAEAARQRGLDNVHFHGQVPLDEVPPLLAASDALLVTLSAHPTFAEFVPSKMIDFMATGRPVVVAAAGEPARLLRRAGGGIAVPPEEPAALADALRALKGDPGRARELGSRGRAFARQRLRSTQAVRLEEILLDVAAHGR